MTETTLMALVVAAGFLAGPAAHADVRAGINAAPPPVVVSSPLRLVAVPDSPVYHGSSADHNLFVYGGRYYSFHRGQWFLGAGPGSSWSIIASDRVPKPVLAVSTTYSKMVHGQGKSSAGKESTNN